MDYLDSRANLLGELDVVKIDGQSLVGIDPHHVGEVCQAAADAWSSIEDVKRPSTMNVTYTINDISEFRIEFER